ncbi:MAG TPA: type I asparaginase [Bacteroidales bacterium]|nr:type I asparaginase [Bacteroidales bacterium]HRZ76051.1 type I asparaginase [Bacteroidales bacterium]
MNNISAENETSLLVIYTGGTIGMVKDPGTGSLTPIDFNHINEHVPILDKLRYRISHHCFDPPIDSSEVKPAFWQQLATVIGENYSRYDGFVVLHGTDTMSYTASALSFMLENLNKPVILTGSQLPMGVIRSDGRENFLSSLEIAAMQVDGTPLVPEVAIFFENQLFRGNRSTKFNAENFHAFVSENYPVLAEAGVHIRFNHAYIRKPNFRNLRVHSALGEEVAILKLFPGISHAVVASLLHSPGLRGLILETFGAGNAPTDDWFIRELQQAIERGLVICNVTQCKGGAVDMGRYASSLPLERIGVISGYDITTESAVTKLMHLFGQGYDAGKVKELFTLPLRGEITK